MALICDLFNGRREMYVIFCARIEKTVEVQTCKFYTYGITASNDDC